jgi:hypothetical protein
MKTIHIFDHSHYHDALLHQVGHGIPVFNRYRQKGGGLGSILGYIGRYAIPLFNKYIMPHAKTAITNTVNDVVSGKSVAESLKSNSAAMAKNVGRAIINRQTGSGLGPTKRVKSVDLDSIMQSKPTRKVRRKSAGKVKKSKSKKQSPSKKKSIRRKHISKRDIFG